jgi:hypothetical protein
MTARWHVGFMCKRRLTASSEGRNPISLLLSPGGLEYTGTRTAFINEALESCRLCRLLKDFLDRTEAEALVRRQRLQTTEGTHADEHVRFVLHLTRTQFTISTPDVVFSGILRFRPTTSPGKSRQEDLWHVNE